MRLVDPGARRASNPGSEARDPAEERGPLSLTDRPVTAAEARERIKTLVYDDHDALGIAVAHRIAALIRERAAAGRPAVLGLATGSTPLGVYRELVRLHREDGLTILLVEQRVAEALERSDHGYVLETGHIVLEGPYQTLLADDRVRRSYLGLTEA